MKLGQFHDKLEQFNYFGNDAIRQQAIEQLMKQNDEGREGNADGEERRGARRRAMTGAQGVYRGADGKIY